MPTEGDLRDRLRRLRDMHHHLHDAINDCCAQIHDLEHPDEEPQWFSDGTWTNGTHAIEGTIG